MKLIVLGATRGTGIEIVLQTDAIKGHDAGVFGNENDCYFGW
jgi:hypothetical protein